MAKSDKIKMNQIITCSFVGNVYQPLKYEMAEVRYPRYDMRPLSSEHNLRPMSLNSMAPAQHQTRILLGKPKRGKSGKFYRYS